MVGKLKMVSFQKFKWFLDQTLVEGYAVINFFSSDTASCLMKQPALVFLWCWPYVSRMQVCPSQSLLCTYIIFFYWCELSKKKLNHALVKVKYGPMHFLPKILLLPVLMVTFFLFSLMYLRYIIRGIIMGIWDILHKISENKESRCNNSSSAFSVMVSS
jgi:hypothetical protein